MRHVSTTTHPLPDYALGHSDHETARLILQHQLYGPITRQLLLAAGVTRGMKVLDVGSGAGDVALLLADLVGPTGQVVGVDANPAILETARSRARAAGWSNVRFVEGDLADLPIGDDDFHAVVGRWILMYLAEPAALVARLATRLQPGGVIAFQESDLRSGAQTFPPVPMHEQLRTWMAPQDAMAGPAVAMGPQLFATFVDAGLPHPELRLDAPIGGGPRWPGYAYLAESARSLLPFMEQVGVIAPGTIDVDTLEDALRDEVVASDAVQLLPAVVGAWSRVGP